MDLQLIKDVMFSNIIRDTMKFIFVNPNMSFYKKWPTISVRMLSIFIWILVVLRMDNLLILQICNYLSKEYSMKTI